MRPAGIARLVSGNSSSSIASAGFMVAMMLVPRASPRPHRIVGDLEDRGRAVEDRGVALDVEGEDRRADHDHEVMIAQRVRKLRRRGMQEACELRMPLRETSSAPKTG